MCLLIFSYFEHTAASSLAPAETVIIQKPVTHRVSISFLNLLLSTWTRVWHFLLGDYLQLWINTHPGNLINSMFGFFQQSTTAHTTCNKGFGLYSCMELSWKSNINGYFVGLNNPISHSARFQSVRCTPTRKPAKFTFRWCIRIKKVSTKIHKKEFSRMKYGFTPAKWKHRQAKQTVIRIEATSDCSWGSLKGSFTAFTQTGHTETRRTDLIPPPK